MADQPLPVTTRTRFFNGQFLVQEDFTDEQNYHLARERGLARALGVSGIVRGLDVTVTRKEGATSTTVVVAVTAGEAVDALGRQLVLREPVSVELADLTVPATLTVDLMFREQETLQEEKGGRDNRRYEEKPVVVVRNGAQELRRVPDGALTHPDEAPVLLVAASVGTGPIATVPGPRSGLALAGGLMVGADAMVTGGLTVDGGATVTGKLTANSDVEVTGGLTVSKIATVTGLLAANGGATVTGKLTASSDVEVTGGLTVTRTATVTGLLAANGGATVTGKLKANSGVEVAGGLTVTAGGATITGKLTANDGLETADGLTVTSGGATITGTLKANNGLDVTGDVKMQGSDCKLTVNGPVEIIPDDTLRSGLTVKGMIRANNALIYSSLYVNNLGGSGYFEINNFADFVRRGSELKPMNPPSDMRLKRDTDNLDGALDRIRQLRGFRFRWSSEGLAHLTRDLPRLCAPEASDDENRALDAEYRREQTAHIDRPQAGLSAQDVREVLPEAVSADEQGYLRVDYNAVTALLVEALKEQQDVIESLRRQVEVR